MKNLFRGPNKSTDSNDELAAEFLRNSIFAAGFVITVYGVLYIQLKAYLAAYFTFGCLLTFIPVILLLIQKKQLIWANFVTVLASTITVGGISVSLKLQAGVEYFYLPGMMLSLILFKPEHKKHIFLSVLLPLISWLATNLLPNPFENSPLLAPSDFPYKTFTISNFIGAALLMSVFIKFYSSTLRRAKEFEVEAEHRLMVSSKMASLGELASGIAHEINNPLSIIIGRTQLLKSKLDQIEKEPFDPKICMHNLEKIEETASLIARIVKGLKDFSRNADADPLEPHSVHKIINFSAELCMDKLSQNQISMHMNLNQDIQIKCRDIQIIQVLVNLINNSIDAVEKLPNKWIRIDVEKTLPQTLKISVTDSGTGIAESNVKKIMQPFFSTKEVGKGLGLGLSISKGIIEAHNGQLIYDESSRNTKFTIELPLIV